MFFLKIKWNFWDICSQHSQIWNIFNVKVVDTIELGCIIFALQVFEGLSVFSCFFPFVTQPTNENLLTLYIAFWLPLPPTNLRPDRRTSSCTLYFHLQDHLRWCKEINAKPLKISYLVNCTMLKENTYPKWLLQIGRKNVEKEAKKPSSFALLLLSPLLLPSHPRMKRYKSLKLHRTDSEDGHRPLLGLVAVENVFPLLRFGR